MSHIAPCRTTLRFADGEVLELPNPARDATVFEQAKAAGIALAHDCLNGTCGTCRASLHGGSVAYAIDRSHLALDPACGQDVLVCQARATSSALDILFPYTRASLQPERRRKLRVTAIRKVCASVWEVWCKAEGQRMFPFLAGQYVRIQPAGTDFERVYSPASAPGAAEQQFLIRALDAGRMSAYLRDQAQVGDVWQVSGPYGVFYRRHVDAPALYIAGGTGLAPILSMLREQAARTELRAPMTLVFGVTGGDDLFHLEEIAGLRQAMPRLDVRICVVAGSPLPGLVQGTVLDAIAPADVDALGSTGRAYLCGPPAMLAAVRTRLGALRLPASQVSAEEFLPTLPSA